jgi:RNA polymerase sigma-70 factor (ECF subfamily)
MLETELITKLKQRDEEAFRIIFNDNQKNITNTCYRIVNDKDAADDITQEVFVKVWSSIDSFRSGSKLSTWIYRIAVTSSLDYLRAQKRKKRYLFLQPFYGEDQKKPEIKATDGNPGILMENAERMMVLNNALNKLPANQRISFLLSKDDEMSSKEIAEILNTTVSAVVSLIHRAKKNLEKILFKYYTNTINN